jgi:hypothetical protein
MAVDCQSIKGVLAMSNKVFLLLSACVLAGCGGSSTGGSSSGSANFTTLTVFGDGAGVARGTSGSAEFVYIAPNIVADVAASNAAGSSTPVDITQFPIISVSNGYNIRQGTVSSGGVTVNAIVAEKTGSGTAAIAYLYNNYGDAIAAGGGTYSSAPTGSHNYSGIYVAGGRYSSFAEIGSLSLTANFSANTFSINASSANSSLTGSGYIDASNGRISSGNLTFTAPNSSTYGATAIGNLTGSGATDVSGVFYTNDSNPDYAGAYAGFR